MTQNLSHPEALSGLQALPPDHSARRQHENDGGAQVERSDLIASAVSALGRHLVMPLSALAARYFPKPSRAYAGHVQCSDEDHRQGTGQGIEPADDPFVSAEQPRDSRGRALIHAESLAGNIAGSRQCARQRKVHSMVMARRQIQRRVATQDQTGSATPWFSQELVDSVAHTLRLNHLPVPGGAELGEVTVDGGDHGALITLDRSGAGLQPTCKKCVEALVRLRFMPLRVTEVDPIVIHEPANEGILQRRPGTAGDVIHE